MQGWGPMTVVDNAVYADGRRCVAPQPPEATRELLRERNAGGSECLAWIGLYRPDEQEIASVAAEFGLHELAVEDAGTPISGRSWNAMATPCSRCCARPATSTPPR